MLSGASSCARARVSPTRPALAVDPCGRRAAPVCALKPPMFTITPPPARRRCGRQACAQLNAPPRITAVTARHSASVMRSKACSARTAALLTRISMRPKCAAAAETITCTASGSVTSATSATALPPACSIPTATPSASPRFARALTTTAAPPSASASAIARPMLRPAPVTRATRPDSSSGTALPEPRSSISGIAQTGLAEAGNAIDRDNNSERDHKHDQAENRNRAQVTRFVEIKDKNGNNLGLRREQHDRRRELPDDADEDEAPGRDHAGAEQRRGDVAQRA